MVVFGLGPMVALFLANFSSKTGGIMEVIIMKPYKLIIVGLTMIAIALSLPGADPLRTMVAAAVGLLSGVIIRIFR